MPGVPSKRLYHVMSWAPLIGNVKPVSKTIPATQRQRRPSQNGIPLKQKPEMVLIWHSRAAIFTPRPRRKVPFVRLRALL